MSVEAILGHIGFLTADGDLSSSQYCAAKAGSTANTVALATSKNDKIIGIIQNDPTTGKAVDLAVSGATKMKAGAAITAWDQVTIDTSGRAITANAAAKDVVVGIAIMAATALGDIITVLLLPVGASQGAYRIARGIHRQVAAADTVVTGLATVVAAVVSFDDQATVKQLFCSATIGDQAGTPAAGSIIIKTQKPTAVNDVTPTAATDFTDNIDLAWIAVGT